MKDKKFILDATAGFRMMWFNKSHPNTVYVDERPECEPDIIGDFKNLKQFKDESFRLIVFDPPHIVQKSPYGGSEIILEYGYLKPETWQQTLKDAFSELWRVLKPYGILLFKWQNTHIASNEVIKLSPCKPLFYQVSKVSRVKHKKRWSSNQLKTLWFCFMKIPEEQES